MGFDADGDGALNYSEWCNMFQYWKNREWEDDDGNDDGSDDGTDAQAQLDEWVNDQDIPESNYYCYLDIATHWVNGYYFFAGHDCDIYNLTLTVMVQKLDWNEKKTAITSDAEQLGDCTEIGVQDLACKFRLTPENNKLGIAFNTDAVVDLYYESEWADVVAVGSL